MFCGIDECACFGMVREVNLDVLRNHRARDGAKLPQELDEVPLYARHLALDIDGMDQELITLGLEARDRLLVHHEVCELRVWGRGFWL